MTNKLYTFLVHAKKATYAGTQGDSKKALPDGSKEFTFTQENYSYRDRYFASNPFAGEEVVFLNHKAIWIMNYYGSVLDSSQDENEIYGFLKKALLNVPEDKPFRGPSQFRLGDLLYSMDVKTNDESFIGHEAIYQNNSKIYELFFHGGMLN